MHETSSVLELRQLVRAARAGGDAVGLVPTMGALHAGHLRLAEVAGEENELVVMSIFVNPTQFGPHEDLARYPRDLDRDRRLAQDAGIDILFVPDVDAVYPGGADEQVVWIDPGPLAAHMEGASRPGHFRGVATVVAKLLNMALPDRAYFGQKDAQQALLVTRMVQDLAFPVELRVIPTVREPDGLALSSRNVYLTSEQRAQAVSLHAALQLARQMIASGERSSAHITAAMRALIGRDAPAGRIDYVEVADLATLVPLTGSVKADALIALAVSFGSTRLIDNLIVRFQGDEVQFS
jgi:pantoate--beta-alanine ligase